MWLERHKVCLKKLQVKLGEANLERIEKIANRLNAIVIALANGNDGIIENYEVQFNELREEYLDAQRTFDDLYGYNYDNNVQYRLTRFGNEISIVFQNFKADRNILFTGDFGKKMNWSFIEKNRDGLVKLHSCYDVIKIPHHGTDSYYHSFLKRIQATSELMIPNGYINQHWNVSSKYNADSIKKKNGTVCAHNTTCSEPICLRCRCIYPNSYRDI